MHVQHSLCRGEEKTCFLVCVSATSGCLQSCTEHQKGCLSLGSWSRQSGTCPLHFTPHILVCSCLCEHVLCSHPHNPSPEEPVIPAGQETPYPAVGGALPQPLGAMNLLPDSLELPVMGSSCLLVLLCCFFLTWKCQVRRSVFLVLLSQHCRPLSSLPHRLILRPAV